MELSAPGILCCCLGTWALQPPVLHHSTGMLLDQPTSNESAGNQHTGICMSEIMLTSGRQGALVLPTIAINLVFNNNKEP